MTNPQPDIIELESEQVTQRLIRPVPKIGEYFAAETKIYIHLCLHSDLSILHTEEHKVQNKADVLKIFVPMIRDLKAKGYRKGWQCIIAFTTSPTDLGPNPIYSSPFKVVPKRKTEFIKKKPEAASDGPAVTPSFDAPAAPNPPPLHNVTPTQRFNPFSSLTLDMPSTPPPELLQSQKTQKSETPSAPTSTASASTITSSSSSSSTTSTSSAEALSAAPLSKQFPPVRNLISTLPALRQAYDRTRSSDLGEGPIAPLLNFWSVGFDAEGTRVYKFAHPDYNVVVPEQNFSLIFTAFEVLDKVSKGIDLAPLLERMCPNTAKNIHNSPGGPHDYLQTIDTCNTPIPDQILSENPLKKKPAAAQEGPLASPPIKFELAQESIKASPSTSGSAPITSNSEKQPSADGPSSAPTTPNHNNNNNNSSNNNQLERITNTELKDKHDVDSELLKPLPMENPYYPSRKNQKLQMPQPMLHSTKPFLPWTTFQSSMPHAQIGPNFSKIDHLVHVATKKSKVEDGPEGE